MDEFLDFSNLINLSNFNKNCRNRPNKTLAFKNYKTFTKYFDLAIYQENTELLKKCFLTEQGRIFIFKKALNLTDNKNMWNVAIKKNDLKLLNILFKNKDNISWMESEDVKFTIIYSAVNNLNFELLKILIEYVDLRQNEEYTFTRIVFLVYHAIYFNFSYSRTSEQLNLQFEIVKLILGKKEELVKTLLKNEFGLVLVTFNIPLINHLLGILEVDLNDSIYGIPNLVRIVKYLHFYPNHNVEIVFRMFRFLINKGVDPFVFDNFGNSVYDLIYSLSNKNLQNKLLKYLPEEEEINI